MSEILGFGIGFDKRSKTFSACTDQMRHLREMFTEQKFFREQRSIVKVKSFSSIPILKMSEILVSGISSDKKGKTFGACTDQMRHFREMFTEQKFFREQ